MRCAAGVGIVLLASLVSLLAGCADPSQSRMELPRLFGAGPERVQQAKAERFDPYPENEPGPAIEGARPPGYENPLPEVVRGRWVRPAPTPNVPFGATPSYTPSTAVAPMPPTSYPATASPYPAPQYAPPMSAPSGASPQYPVQQ
ncbi:MAG: hypothetical protein ACOY3P_21380 [Planctomycetota bacterium]